MGMNNVFYRGRGFLESQLRRPRPGLRMGICPGIPKAFELWSFAVSRSAGARIASSYEHAAYGRCGPKAIFEALKAAAVVSGVAQALATIEALAKLSVCTR